MTTVPLRGRFHAPRLLFGVVETTDPPTVRLADDDDTIPLDWIDDTLTLRQDARVLVCEVAPRQWAAISTLSKTTVA